LLLLFLVAVQPSARGETSNGEVPRGEIVLWVDSWVACTKSLTQWDVLADYSRNSDNVSLAMDCLWRLHDWETLSHMLSQNQGQVRSLNSNMISNLIMVRLATAIVE
jgi:hypothetical protein